MARVVRIGVELLTEEAFRPFGELIAVGERVPDFRGVNSDGWQAPFEVDGPPAIMLLSSRYEGLRFTRLERHFGVTQSFVPLGRVPALVAVAAPTTADDPEAIPRPEDVRGFVVDGSVGYLLKRGTWHSLDRYPLYPAPAQIVIITGRDTQVELQTVPRQQWRLTQEVDYAERFGITFEFAP